MRKIIKLIGIVIILIFIGICVLEKECSDELYIKMSAINDNKILIGLSEEEGKAYVRALMSDRSKAGELMKNWNYETAWHYKLNCN